MKNRSRWIVGVLSVGLASAIASASQPEDGPAGRARGDDAKAAFPAGRDYMRERAAMIRAKFPAPGPGRQVRDAGIARIDLMRDLRTLAAMWHFAGTTSTVYRAYEAKAGEGSWPASTHDLLDAVSGRLPTPNPDLAAEARRIFKELDALGAFTSIKQLPTERVFPEAVVGLDRPGLMMLTPWLGDARQASRILVARASAALADGDHAAYLDLTAQTLALARALETDGTLISYLVSVAVEAMVHTRITEDVLEGRIDGRLAPRVLAVIDRAPLADHVFALESERLFTLDAIDWAYGTNARALSDLLSITAANDFPAIGIGRLLWAPREDQLHAADRLYSALVDRLSAKPDPALQAWAREFMGRLEANQASRNRYALIALLMPAFDRVTQRVVPQYLAQRGGVRMILAAEAFKADTGEYPADADRLAPRLIGEIPEDPFLRGHRLRYRLVDPGEDRLGRPYLVYAVGPDGEDHGGRDDDRDQYRALMKDMGRGYDLVINWKHIPEPRD
ncbi:MAG: hypothetical protein HRU70_07190 [Phycisphaeraceae bacterium]|nr:MAG: hypothetical protein HRU70_07190 [Phycisphaeraceae bacterium]